MKEPIFFAQIVSLPFIRNHVFARNDTKGAVFKAFQAFSKGVHEMQKKKTVNLRFKNAILCLTFAFRKQIRFLGGRLFFEYSDALFEGGKRKSEVGIMYPDHFHPLYRCEQLTGKRFRVIIMLHTVKK